MPQALLMHVELITIGDELLLGFTIDTNAAHLARTLAAVGIQVVRRATVGDTAEEIASAVREALERTGAVITTGGLGPTSDDLTKPAIAALFGRAMREDAEHVAWMQERWRTLFGAEMPAVNRQQAMIPEGARKLVNRHGSAPGIWLEDERGRWVAMLPGVPREMRGMLGDELLPVLRERAGGGAGGGGVVVLSRTLRTTGIGESKVAEVLGDLAKGPPGMPLASLPGWEGTDLRLTARGHDEATAARTLDDEMARIRERLGDYVYGDADTDLAALVLERCRAESLTIATAESCTGGLLGARLTAIPGSSDVVLGGVIAYANRVKTELLGVEGGEIEVYGAVSEPVARAMASGARDRVGADIGIGITGVAGPSGGTPEKPVGTVWIAVDFCGDVTARRSLFIGDRQEIRQRATQAALDMVRRAVGRRA
ncbi:MAG TPA: competence/damage-inducible protein A [Gemmatimonadaceae bacterium]|nr:competence/damage-inducible protein A [Gemmatimonadaceae bacterium]